MVPGRVITLVMTMVFLFILNNICTPLCLCLGMAQCIRHLPLGKRDGGGRIKLVSQMHFKVKQTLEKTVLSTVSRPREAEEADVR